jgi:uncharacterized LabA/DUF88 family protein
MGAPRPRTRVYVDGFNFYYASFRRGAFADYKWLDPVRFSEVALPRNEIELVRFFTARLDPSHGHRAQRERQDTYLLALEGIPRLTVHFGEFVVNRKRQWLVNPEVGGPRSADVWVPEEKGSDVNLASYLLLDAFRDSFDVGVVVSNDSDLLEPVRIAREELGRTVGVLRVDGGQRRCIFSGRVDFIRTVRRGHYAASQLPEDVMSSHGHVIRKPREWCAP